HEHHLTTKLLGRHQIENAAMAIGIVEVLQEKGVQISSEAFSLGIAETQWPGRFEIVRQNPCVILDGAHNSDSCQKLVSTVREVFPNRFVTLILGLSHDKDKAQIIPILKSISSRWIWTKANHPRAAEFSDEVLAVDRDIPWEKTSSVKEALALAQRHVEENSVILVTGSLFVVAEAKKYV
ncbi:MAG: bifunctional folylpolyglutamate synthase/dihydrofolate synthase, partial [Candidatus Omnitrophica bacterium]|nr:bifunctional folylpolyglutamate synthase/dihydrofolate synthase [Candidatus Omnitrophota bacterium]